MLASDCGKISSAMSCRTTKLKRVWHVQVQSTENHEQNSRIIVVVLQGAVTVLG